MSEKTNFPNPLLRGGPTHIHYDRDNSTTADIAANSTFTGEWQKNTAKDVLVSYHLPKGVSILLDISDDDGANFSTEVLATNGNDYAEVCKKVGPRSIRIRAINKSQSLATSVSIYLYHGDFIRSEITDILRGGGEGTEEDPFVQHVEDQEVSDLLCEVISELKAINFQLQIITSTDVTNIGLD
jgi:hypothetical protein